MNEGKSSWHTEVISSELADTAKRLTEIKTLSSFYLAGGTGLALHLGHRRSVDLDFFSPAPFNEDALIAAVQGPSKVSVLSKSKQTVYLQMSGTKVSFIEYDYPLLFPLDRFQGLAVADVRDITAMKISALASRGSRRDFVDLYVVAREYDLPLLLELFERKFAKANYNMVHVRKALTYFADADKEAMPDMLVPLSWNQVKEYFVREVTKIRLP